MKTGPAPPISIAHVTEDRVPLPAHEQDRPITSSDSFCLQAQAMRAAADGSAAAAVLARPSPLVAAHPGS